MFLRVLKESFARAKGRQALAALAVMLGTAVATAMLAVFLDVGDRMSRELRSFGANITVIPAADTLPVEIGGIDYRPVTEGAYISEDLLPRLKMIFWRNNIMSFAPFLYVPVTLEGGRGEGLGGTVRLEGGRGEGLGGTVRLEGGHHAVMVGTWFDHEFALSNGERYRTGVRETNPTWKVEGSWPKESGGETLLGRLLAEKLRLGPGAELAVAPGTTVRVSGILTTGGSEEDQIFVPLALAQRIAHQPGRVRRVQVSALTQPEDDFARRDPRAMNRADYDRWYCTAYVSSIAHQIEEALPGTVARQVRQVAQNEGEVLGRIRLLMLLVTAAALAASALAVSSSTAAMVIERRAQIALMKALGSPDWLVAAFFLAESAVQGLLGGALGYAAGHFLAGVMGRQIFGASTAPPAVLLPMVLAVAVAVSWLGAWWPLQAAIRVLPAPVLKEGK